jgi:hypothetical protein
MDGFGIVHPKLFRRIPPLDVGGKLLAIVGVLFVGIVRHRRSSRSPCSARSDGRSSGWIERLRPRVGCVLRNRSSCCSTRSRCQVSFGDLAFEIQEEASSGVLAPGVFSRVRRRSTTSDVICVHHSANSFLFISTVVERL